MLVFALLLPMFTYLFRRGVHSFEARESIPHALAQLLVPRNLVDVLRSQKLPSFAEIRAFDWRAVPRRLLVFNLLVTAVYAIGVQASFLASVLDVNVARTALSSLGRDQRHRDDRVHPLRRPDLGNNYGPGHPREAHGRGSALDGVLSYPYGDRRLAARAADLLPGRRCD